MAIDIDNIPRTIDLVRNDSNTSVIPDGYPVLSIIDQTQLPYAEAYLHLTDWREAIEAIKQLKVRGAPAIGIAGAASVALAAAEFCETNKEASHDETNEPADYLEFMRQAAERIAPARPTAVNLMHMVDAAMEIVEEEAVSGSSPVVIADKLYEFTKQLIVEDEDANRKMGEFGAALLEERSSVLTHCNAGSLATAFFGTALGVIYEAALQGKIEMVYADETRPLRQGARLTAFELAKAQVPVTLICDDMAATTMAQGCGVRRCRPYCSEWRHGQQGRHAGSCDRRRSVWDSVLRGSAHFNDRCECATWRRYSHRKARCFRSARSAYSRCEGLQSCVRCNACGFDHGYHY